MDQKEELLEPKKQDLEQSIQDLKSQIEQFGRSISNSKTICSEMNAQLKRLSMKKQEKEAALSKALKTSNLTSLRKQKEDQLKSFRLQYKEV